MKEVIKEHRIAGDGAMEECCGIAESMIDEIHQIAMPCSPLSLRAGERHKGSFKKMLLRQIRMARRMAAI
ncbi:MAG TPA: hypothetical protein PKK11_02455 [Methanothrix sp.]|nr:hypothetical protein [Methanothrix sp.]HPT18583.1 hypothetical protein [Methanothrix sp.]